MHPPDPTRSGRTSFWASFWAGWRAWGLLYFVLARVLLGWRRQPGAMSLSAVVDRWRREMIRRDVRIIERGLSQQLGVQIKVKLPGEYFPPLLPGHALYLVAGEPALVVDRRDELAAAARRADILGQLSWQRSTLEDEWLRWAARGFPSGWIAEGLADDGSAAEIGRCLDSIDGLIEAARDLPGPEDDLWEELAAARQRRLMELKDGPPPATD